MIKRSAIFKLISPGVVELLALSENSNPDGIAGYYVISHTRHGDDLESRQEKRKDSIVIFIGRIDKTLFHLCI